MPVPSDFSRPQPANLAELTTLGVGAGFSRYLPVHSEAEFIEAISEADRAAIPLLVIGGGSNLVGPQQDFPGWVLRDMRSELVFPPDQCSACGGITLRATAGTPWDLLVEACIEAEAAGVEALSGIPGSAGAAPVQNIGAYGAEVSTSLASVSVWDRQLSRRRQLALAELELGYRTSALKTSRQRGFVPPGSPEGTAPSPTGRYVVLEIELQLRNASLSNPVAYQQLAQTLGVELGTRVPLRELRDAVLQLRRSKGMVLDPADLDSHSCGSFFTNPVLSPQQAEALPEGAPRYPVHRGAGSNQIGSAGPVIPGQVKTSAAYLIEAAGFTRGYSLAQGSGRAMLSTKHILAITNRGGAQPAEIWELAGAVQQGVWQRFGVWLEPEAVAIDNPEITIAH